jgi:hypothetical protein
MVCYIYVYYSTISDHSGPGLFEGGFAAFNQNIVIEGICASSLDTEASNAQFGFEGHCTTGKDHL